MRFIFCFENKGRKQRGAICIGHKFKTLTYFFCNKNVTLCQAKALVDSKAAILNDPGMRAIYINPKTNDTWKEGDTYTRLNFADTLERIAKLGFQDFYQGRTAKNFVKDLRQLGGIITLQDLKDYW